MPDSALLPEFDNHKQKLIDLAYTNLPCHPKSFVDVGAVWGIDGAYTYYILETYGALSAYIVDQIITPEVIRQSRAFPQLTIHQGNIADDDFLKTIDQVDMVLLFDILLHQVNPNWWELLKMYASKCEHFLIFNPQYIKSDRTIRLLYLGVDQYFKTIPHNPDEPNYRELIEHPNQVHPILNRPWRDIHHIWQ